MRQVVDVGALLGVLALNTLIPVLVVVAPTTCIGV